LAAENFDSLRDAYNNWERVVKPSDSRNTVNREAADAIYQKMKTLRVSLQQAVKPYPEVARLYETLEIVSSGRVAELAAVQINLPQSATADMEGRLVTELQGLIIAKSLADHPEFRSNGIALLKTLVNRGNVVCVAALSSLAGLVTTDQEKAEVLAMIPAIIQQQPWQQAELDKVAQRVALAGNPG
jgi:hypothetical protein